ncbi:hypothetical protein E8E14_007193 [Neopestalotiopsis sp. 37M]|nr:hypothetical protein E8E14_007193 [Neopestalotiopsis sp. 37M]
MKLILSPRCSATSALQHRGATFIYSPDGLPGLTGASALAASDMSDGGIKFITGFFWGMAAIMFFMLMICMFMGWSGKDFIDDTEEIVRSYQHESSGDENQSSSEEPEGRMHHHQDGVSSTVQPVLRLGGRAHAPSLQAHFSLSHEYSRDRSISPIPTIDVTQHTRVSLLEAYLQETATWCETTDSEYNFSIQFSHSMIKSESYAAAAMALASRQRDSLQRQNNSLTLELYQYAIRLLLRHDPVEADLHILATCTVLCVYEMMVADVKEWRRHLGGCAGLLKSHGWNGSSDGIAKTCFWAFARIDIWAAFLMNQATLIPTESWVVEESLEAATTRDNIDDYCNLAILMFARLTNLINTFPNDGNHSETVETPSTMLDAFYYSVLGTFGPA